MEDPNTPTAPSFLQKFGDAIRTRRAKRIGIGVAAFFAVYTLFGFFGAPPLIKTIGERQLSEQLNRPVTIGHVALNPFLLRLQTDDVHIGGRTPEETFVDVGQLVVRVSWKSLVRFAPIVGEVHIDRPRVHIIRDDAERFNFSDLAAASPPTEEPEKETEPLDLVVERFSIADGTLTWTDKSTPTPAELSLTQLAANVDGFSLTGPEPAAFNLSTALASGGALKAEGALHLAGQNAEANLSVDAVALPAVQPYLATATPARLIGGTASAAIQARADWSKAPVDLMLSDSTVGLKGVRVALPGAETPALSLAEASAAIAKFDLAAQSVEIGKIAVAGLSAEVQRLANGEIDLAALAGTPGAAETPSEPAQPGAPWHYKIGEIALTDARAGFTDATTPTPAKLEIAPLNVTVRTFSDDLSAPLPVTLAGTLNGKGKIGLDGTVTLDPLKIDLKLNGDGIDVTPFDPYAESATNAKIARAVINAQGGLALEQAQDGIRASYRGDLELANVRVINRASSSPFAGWRSLALHGLAARYDAAGGVDVETARVVFSNFSGRVLLDEQGRLHLRDILGKEAGDAAAPKSKPKPEAKAASDAPPVRLHFGRLELQNGQVTYTDNFITPHYTAELTAINGTIGAFGTDATKAAPIDVGARLTANGPISIKGKVNPLAASPSLDLTALAKDIELTNLTAYSTKYTGYPITKGKLNVDLHYRLANDQLSADNHIFIDQLTFGQRVENDTATQLPVQLAIALLTNAKGQIDVDIPVSGSLNDPQFSVGGLVWNAIGNLLTKAITSPFTLLAHAFGAGSGEDLGYVAFAPGSADLPQAAQDKLDTITKMLAGKPSVSLDLIGRVDPEIDVPALREAYVERQVRRQKLRELRNDGQKADPATVRVEPDEYAGYLTEAYRAEMAKRLQKGPAPAKPPTVDEMEAALAESAPVDAAGLTQLAQARVQAVRGYLVGKIPDNRVFVVAPKLDAEGIDDKGATTRVGFDLK